MSARDLLQLLADGGVHSGERLAAHLQVSRTAVWKCIERLRGHGIGVQAQAREGYSLIAPVELLDAAYRSARLEGLPVMIEQLYNKPKFGG